MLIISLDLVNVSRPDRSAHGLHACNFDFETILPIWKGRTCLLILRGTSNDRTPAGAVWRLVERVPGSKLYAEDVECLGMQS
jgi:hypothetical protein